MTSRTLSVPEIHCDHCKASIEGAVTVVPGVEGADVDIDASTVAFDYDGTAATLQAVVDAIEGVGYEVSTDN